MTHALDELIRPLGPRLEPVRRLAVMPSLSPSRPAPKGFFHTHGLGMLTAGLSVAVAVLWSMQAGYLTLTPPIQPAPIVLPTLSPVALPAEAPMIQAAAPTTACTDPDCAEPPAKAISLSGGQDNLWPEIRTGYPPQLNRTEIISLPPDMSSVAVPPVQRTQASPAPKPLAKNKPAAKDVRP